MRITRLKCADGSTVEVALSAAAGPGPRYLVHLPDRELPLDFEIGADGAGWLMTGGRRVPFHVARSDRQLDVWVDGRVYRFEVQPRGPRRSGAAAAAGATAALLAPMPGTILRIEVSRGAAFEAHQALIIMESMKMEMTLSVPHPGVVQEVRCSPGELVERGAELMRFEDPEEPDGTEPPRAAR